MSDLGVLFDTKISFVEHIDIIKDKVFLTWPRRESWQGILQSLRSEKFVLCLRSFDFRVLLQRMESAL